jgi:hypothetical protein
MIDGGDDVGERRQMENTFRPFEQFFDTAIIGEIRLDDLDAPVGGMMREVALRSARKIVDDADGSGWVIDQAVDEVAPDETPTTGNDVNAHGTNNPGRGVASEDGLIGCLSAHNGPKECSVAHRLVSLDLSSGGEPTRRRDLAQIDISVNLRWQDASETGTARKRVPPGSIKKAASATCLPATGSWLVANPGMQR